MRERFQKFSISSAMSVAVVGVSSSRSLGFRIARGFQDRGLRVVVCCKDLALRDRVRGLFPPPTPAARLEEKHQQLPHRGEVECVVCDVDSDASVAACFGEGNFPSGSPGKGLRALVHAVGFAPQRALRGGGGVLKLEREDFLVTMGTSAFSLPLLARHAAPLFDQERGGAVVALTFDGASRVVRGYEAMAPAKAALETMAKYLAVELGPRRIRVNCVSAGPVNTPAGRGLADFPGMLKHAEQSSPLGHGVSHDDVWHAVDFLCSDAAGGVTGQVVHVDAGLSVVGWARARGRACSL